MPAWQSCSLWLGTASLILSCLIIWNLRHSWRKTQYCRRITAHQWYGLCPYLWFQRSCQATWWISFYLICFISYWFVLFIKFLTPLLSAARNVFLRVLSELNMDETQIFSWSSDAHGHSSLSEVIDLWLTDKHNTNNKKGHTSPKMKKYQWKQMEDI